MKTRHATKHRLSISIKATFFFKKNDDRFLLKCRKYFLIASQEYP